MCSMRWRGGLHDWLVKRHHFFRVTCRGVLNPDLITTDRACVVGELHLDREH